MDNGKKEMYDVNEYSDQELYNILDLNNPSDRELEAKIISLYRRYENMQTPSGDKLAKFFSDMHDRFFEANEEDEQEDETEEQEQEDVEAVEEQPELPEKENIIIEGLTNTTTPASSSKITIPVTTAISTKTMTEYSKGQLNPTIKDTIKRIISIDSKYRDDKTNKSTNFTFNLSEPLRDVVSLKLYSIQVPQTWYTVATSYGCNFFYLQGNSPGIDNGAYDYKIDISAGNYTSNTLISALNTKIQEIKTQNLDISFGNTQIGYNPNAALATLSISLKKIYNETSYYLYFPTWTNPNSNATVGGPRYQSIPGFLGYNFTKYYLNCLYSSSTLLSTTNTIGNNSDNINVIYFIDGSNNTNNYFTVYKYIGPGEYSATSIVDLSFTINLSIKGVCTRTQIVNDLSNQLGNNKYLSGSNIVRRDITNPSLLGYGNSYFELKINYNRSTTNNIENSKTRIVFPTETITSQYNPVWVGATSCFRFPNADNELNNVISETPPIEQASGKYTILNNPYIYLKETKPYYDVIENDYSISIANSSQAGYSLQQYVNAINAAIEVTNNTTITTKNPLGDFNLRTFVAFVDASSTFNLDVDLNKTFTRDMYYIDLSNSFLKSFMGISGEYLNGIKDLSGSTYEFTGSFIENSSYLVENDVLLTAYPSKLKYGNQNALPFIVLSEGIGTRYTSYLDIENAINNGFSNYTDLYGQQVFSGTNIVMTPNPLTGYIDCVLTIVIKKVLSQKDYTIGFIDHASFLDSTNIIVPSSSSWGNHLKIGINYLATALNASGGYLNGGKNLSNVDTGINSYTRITASSAITVNTIKFEDGVNNFFYLKPYEKGVSTSPPYYLKDSGANDIKYVIPAVNGKTVINYTRENLIIAINAALNAPSVSNSSSINIISVNNKEYTKLRFDINKIYTATDYKIVFYDQLNFVKCYSGASSIQNTTWDTTIGWLIGFHGSTEYALSDYGKPGDNIQIVGDTTVSVNLYDYFLLCIDDYTQNHMNDGLVTVASAQQSIPLPSYANRADYTCDPVTGLLTYNVAADNTTTHNKLTQSQLYTLTEIANSKRSSTIISNSGNVSSKSYGSGPFVKDVFGFIPMKTAGLAPGAVYVDYGGTLQNQERSYFGPVNIFKMAVQLVSNNGDIVDLNGSDWSFSLIAEQLYQQKADPNKDKSKK